LYQHSQIKEVEDTNKWVSIFTTLVLFLKSWSVEQIFLITSAVVKQIFIITGNRQRQVWIELSSGEVVVMLCKGLVKMDKAVVNRGVRKGVRLLLHEAFFSPFFSQPLDSNDSVFPIFSPTFSLTILF